MSGTTTRAKALAGNVRLEFPIQLPSGQLQVELELDVTTAHRKNKAKEFRSMCPHCTSALHQSLACAEHGSIDSEDVRKAKELPDGSLVAVTAAEIEAINQTDLEPGTFRVGVYDGKSVELATLATGSVYRLRTSMEKRGTKKLPTKPQWSQGYAILHGIVTDRSVAILAEWTYRGSQKLYRIEPFGSQLVLRELVRPEEIAEADTFDVPEIPGAVIDAARNGLMREHFDPTVFEDKRTKRAQALIAAKAAGEDVVMPEEPAPAIAASGGLDLVAALEASLAAAPKKKAPAKRTTKAAKAA